MPVAAVAALLFVSCSRNSELPNPASAQYRDFIGAFYVGVAGLQTGEDGRAKEKLTLATRIAPGEPASWADLGLLAVRQQEFDAAYKYAERARSLMPGNSRIEALLGLIESRRGKLPEAIGHLKKAASLDPKNLKALYALAEETERQAGAASDAEAEKLFARLLDQRPGSTAVLLEVARLAAKTGDSQTLKVAVSKLVEASVEWPDQAKQQMRTLERTAAAANPREAALQVVFVRNSLAPVPQYRQSLNDVKTPAAFVSEPFLTFLKLPAPNSEAAAADLAVRFDSAPLKSAIEKPVSWIGAMPLDSQGKASILWADGSGVQIAGGARLPFPGAGSQPLSRDAILGADLNYDFLTDLVFAGSRGVSIFLQNDLNHFTDITARTRLPVNVIKGAYSGVWAFDVDLDGDLDIVLGVNDGEPVVLRNNGDNTFAIVRPFPGVSGLTAFASADIDGDGDPDVAMIGGDGRLYVFGNERLGQFRPRPLPSGLDGRFLAVVAADINNDGAIDFVLLRNDGSVIRLSDRNQGSDWDVANVVRANPGGSPTLLVADFDNNGSPDLLVGDGQIFMADGKNFSRLPFTANIAAPSAVDLNGDGRMDLIGLSRSSTPIALLNRGVRSYHWQNLSVRAAHASGDQRINSFGIGGEVEIRSGLLAQKQGIHSQALHFGLGEHTQVDVARIIWPNGVAQAEFELKADQEILAQQRLKGSCPWLFAWDGTRMSFVKDGAPWSPALGLHINAQVVAGIYQTQEWFKIPGESLQPRDGFYDLRVTGELWETYYIDHYSMLVVDHPQGTEIYTDERFAVPPPPLKIFTTAEPQPFATARDDLGHDVAAIVKNLDRKYLDTFGRGPYQGLTRDHWVELDLPDNAPRAGLLYLLGTGWVHPTDATVNIAIGQSGIPPPEGLSIEVPDKRGNWVTAKKNLGFPAGKMKTVVLDLTGVFLPGAPRKLRLRTNLEIYWDKLEWAVAAPDHNRIAHLGLSGAELRYRGFSAVQAADQSSPELPDYNQLAGTGQIWHDLEGYYTRYGDVRELLDKIDDRMVITNAGDEVRLRFTAPDPPPAGWKRDYVMIGDGWIKDGDFNSVFSKTVLPLPCHGMRDYTMPPRQLEDDRAYRLHPADWQSFHTRYITPGAFERALRN